MTYPVGHPQMAEIKKYIIYLAIVAFHFQLLSAQNSTKLSSQIDSLVVLFRDIKVDEAEAFIKSRPIDPYLKEYAQWNINYLKKGIINKPSSLSSSKKVRDTSKSQQLFLRLLINGEYLKLTGTDEKRTFDLYNEARQIAVALDNGILISEAQRRIIQLLYNDFDDKIDILPEELTILKKYSTAESDKLWYLILESIFYISKDLSDQSKNLKYGLKESKKIGNKYLEARFNQMLGVNYYKCVENYALSNQYYDQAVEIYRELDLAFTRQRALDLHINFGVNAYRNGQPNEAILNLLLYLNYEDLTTNKHYSSMAFDWLSKSYEKLKKNDSALFYLDKKIEFDSILNKRKFAAAISKAQIENQTSEQQKKILEQENDLLLTEQKKTQNQNIAIALGGSLLTVSLIGFLLFKNTKRKQRIAEQEKELEIQKTEKILKEQELTTIDAMIAGQEKERQRLASDLHDSVGATLSAARLQFDHIAKNKDKLDTLDELLNKTGVLLNDAYNEVRSMAHLKNSGVIAKNGLLPAVEKLAKNASGTNKLKVEVEDFGLENRLENTLEITIFRIIQELVTNVIKHAEASEATISITQHKDSLNIIVEDNGRGFDTQIIQQKEGMGLSGVERRVEHLEGTLEVDSTPGKGTSVLIDIPL
ncbi:MAG: sensor histidine kinase [Bacteroidota bacterium]